MSEVNSRERTEKWCQSSRRRAAPRKEKKRGRSCLLCLGAGRLSPRGSGRRRPYLALDGVVANHAKTDDMRVGKLLAKIVYDDSKSLEYRKRANSAHKFVPKPPWRAFQRA